MASAAHLKPAATIVLAVSAACLLVTPHDAGARGIKGGRIFPGQGAAGVKLDMTRDQVVGRVGRPHEQIGRIMGYSRFRLDLMFDVYLDTQSPRRVRMIGIHGKRFRLDGIRIFKRGGLRKLLGLYGPQLEPVTLETGDLIYRITSQYHGHEVWTDFAVLRHSPSSEILSVFILFPDVPT